MEQKKVFRSRISVLFMVILFLTLIPIFIIALLPLEGYKMLWIFGGITFFSLLLPILLLGGMRYIISEGKLFIKIGFISCGSVDITDIVLVKRSYNPLSSPAASLKRLRIYCATSLGCLISPAREQEFIEALKAINPDIQVGVFDKEGAYCMLNWDI